MTGIINWLEEVHDRLPTSLAALMSLVLSTLAVAVLIAAIGVVVLLGITLEWLGETRTGAVIGIVLVVGGAWGAMAVDIHMKRKVRQ